MWYFVWSCWFVAVHSVAARSSYIVNGGDARAPGIYPWQASFQISEYSFHFCGASLISKRWLVTAAHCADGQKARDVQIVLGMYDIKTKRYGKPRAYNVKQLVVHPKWNSAMIEQDIALIKLASDVEFNNMVKPITLPHKGQRFEGNKDCVISGWGNLKFDRSGGYFPETPNNLQYLRVEVKPTKWCSEIMPKLGAPAILMEDKVCIRPSRKSSASACNGDSGGPLACKSGGKWILVGDASFVVGQCSTDQPNFYGNIAYHRDWIQHITGV